MNVRLALISSLVIVYVRIWIVNTIFSDKKIQIHLTLKIIVVWLILVSMLFFYRYLLQYSGYTKLYFLDNPDRKSIGLFIAYCIAGILLLTTFSQSRYMKIIKVVFLWWFIFIGLGYGGYLSWLNTLLLFYLISAFAEEYLKYSSGTTLFLKEGWVNARDLMFFCILIGLGFSISENFLYIGRNALHHENISILGLALGRWLVSTLIHIVSTSMIAFITLALQKRWKFTPAFIVGIVWWFTIHALYNVSLNYNLNYISIPLIIVCFLLLTYLLYQSDILYEHAE